MKPGFLFFLLFLIIAGNAATQTPVKHFEHSDFTTEDSIKLLNTYGKNKQLIPEFALQTLIALSYFPELKDTHIRFIYKPAHTPLTTKPDFPDVIYKRSKRTFTITISDSSMWKLQPVLLRCMDFNTQIGVLGHELSHIADFSQNSLLQLIGSGIGHIFSSRYIDRFEYRTDSICIAHGLGYQLLAWSNFVRKTMHTENWDGADNINMPVMNRERYMNPQTIMKRIEKNSLYSKL
ncbi:MAG TPA: hypothetical protein VN958_20455 [Chitinophagaceae bacterium]|nr:hypothetical protein [Chitinophagaceae bacterium]